MDFSTARAKIISLTSFSFPLLVLTVVLVCLLCISGICLLVYMYICMYIHIRIAFFIELRLRVSRSLRSLANKNVLLVMCSYSTEMASELA